MFLQPDPSSGHRYYPLLLFLSLGLFLFTRQRWKTVLWWRGSRNLFLLARRPKTTTKFTRPYPAGARLGHWSRLMALLYLLTARPVTSWLATRSFWPQVAGVATPRGLITTTSSGGRPSRSRRRPTPSYSRSGPTVLWCSSTSHHPEPGPAHSGTAAADRRRAREHDLAAASTLSLAPMMEYTDRHFRHVVRLISSRTLLYTEMVAANALAHERRDWLLRQQELQESTTPSSVDNTYLLRFLAQGQVEPREGPSVLQLGGSDPQQMYEAAQTVLEFSQPQGRQAAIDYTALNLNCGCPSPKVANKGCFGAALMEEPALVVQLVQALHEGCQGQFPITVKCRIGTDAHYPSSFTRQAYAEMDEEAEYRRLCHFVETVAASGVVTDFSVHARIAVLRKSFSPADNRKIPPLKYHLVRRLVQDYSPHNLTFTLNGGMESLSQVQAELQAAPGLRGVMIGRAWAADPWSLAMADSILYGVPDDEDDGMNGHQVDTSGLLTKPSSGPKKKNRWQILQEYGRHADWEEQHGDPRRIRRFLVKAVTSLFAGEPHAKRYRIALDEIAALAKPLDPDLRPGSSLSSPPLAPSTPLSELILSAAGKHLSPETLFRTAEESYEKILWEEARQASPNQLQLFLSKKFDGDDAGPEDDGATTRPMSSTRAAVAEWQAQRHEERERQQQHGRDDEDGSGENISHQPDPLESSSLRQFHG